MIDNNADDSIQHIHVNNAMRANRTHNTLSFLNADEHERWESIHGWLLPEAAEELYRLASESDPEHVAVEVGSFAGKSAVCVGKALLHNKGSMEAGRRLYAIDVQFQPQFDANLASQELGEIVTKIQASSLQAADGWSLPISFIYIDAHHGLAHAYADFCVWDMFLVPGGYMALDDTAGFNPGCINAVLAATSTGAYEKISDLGGVTFLRKIKPSPNNINYFPLTREAQISMVAQVCAWMGALDPLLVIPVRQRSKDVASGKEKEDLLNIMQGKLDWISRCSSPSNQLDSTVNYLQAVMDFHSGRYDESIQALHRLAHEDDEHQLISYSINVGELAKLRLGQLYDLKGERQQAMENYESLSAKTKVPELSSLAGMGLRCPYALPNTAPGILLRQYVTESPLSGYRVY